MMAWAQKCKALHKTIYHRRIDINYKKYKTADVIIIARIWHHDVERSDYL